MGGSAPDVVVADQGVEPLHRLAELHGVATSYRDQQQQQVAVDDDVVVTVLAALGVNASDDAAIADSLEQAEAGAADPAVPPVVVTRVGRTASVPAGASRGAQLRLEGGDIRSLPVRAGTVELPVGLPLGWHELVLDGGAGGDTSRPVPVCVAPDSLPAGERGWGWMTQLYAMRSSASWGVGDLADLTTLAEWTAGHGGDLVLVNPLHAVALQLPIQPSPYFPASRRWLNPLYLRIEQLPEYSAAEATLRRQVDARRPAAGEDRIDRDDAWRAKQAALELLFDPAAVEPPTGDLAEFATWCALTERHGADWREWPEALRRPGSPAVVAAAEELADRVLWHAWLQRRTEEQCRAAQHAAIDAGMRIGIVHDLAVGIDAGGADAWTLQDALALDIRIGAPPDAYNQRGQDWGMPPWHPVKLRESAYAPVRDLVRAELRRGGGLRIDHVLGLFRLWWIPVGRPPTEGSFVSYHAEELLGVISLEAKRAGAVIVGEDLGTVPDQVVETLADVGVLGTSLLLFERISRREAESPDEAGRLRPLETWREAAMASITTHDLPTVLGWLRGEHVRVRAELGQLPDVDREWAGWRKERAEMIQFLTAAGLLGTEPEETEIAVAMHAALTRTPSRYSLAAPGDAIGDLRQPNVPGTTDEHPNWRLPIADTTGRPVLLEQLLADPRTSRLADLLRQVAVGDRGTDG